MKTVVKNFNLSYDTYYKSLTKYTFLDATILEIGGGAHPSIKNRTNLSYTIVDPDQSELNKAPIDTIKINGMVQDISSDRKYDLIISKMVLEHVEDPDTFHEKVLDLLTENGRAIHFFACRHSIPAFFNRFLPEFLGDMVLTLLKNRDLDESPKYPAFYKRTLGHTKKQLSYFEKLGYTVENYHSFVGHKYLKSIPIISSLEKMYTSVLYKLKMKRLATVALVILSKK